MHLIGTHDPQYDEARAVHNAMIDRRPAVIAQCATAQDVAHALELAEREGYSVAVRAGGHSVAGMSVNDGGLVIDVRPMKTIKADPDARSVKVGAGVTWGEFDAATQVHGLATTGGRISTTGVAGFTLGGGSGWAERKYGLACDNLISVDLVTADGREITANRTEHPELFWALHGGGGNFGVATAFEFRLHPLGPTVLAGILGWPAGVARDVTHTYRDLAYDAPDELGSGLVFLNGPPEEFVPEHLRGQPIVGMAVLWTGDPGEGRDAIKPYIDLRPDANLVAPMPYTNFQQLIDDPPGMRNYWTADYHDEFSDDAIDVFVKYGAERKSPLTQQILFPWGGAIAQADDGSTPMANRSARWLTHPFAVWEDPADDDANREWARGFHRDIGRYANGGTYLNFLGDEGQDRVRAAYGAGNYARLAAVKAIYDPRNVFRGNQNIKPAA
ncbi:MAG TPA: FAD-binding oxidoreductase [Streptosporangiaceae bacterium]|nr:FAD-binding oxidoreductase [Streptosporangiaceae bacterium]